MKDTQRQHLEQRLLEERARTVRALQRSDENTRVSTLDDGELTTYPLHLADQGTDTMEQEKALVLAGQEGQLLLRIDEALRRLYREPDVFGRCGRCGNQIAMDRLELVPWATRCLGCQTEEENGG